MIFTNSAAFYWLNKSNSDGNHMEDAFNHYGKSKCQAEQVIKAYYDKGPTVIFGNEIEVIFLTYSSKFVQVDLW